MRQVAVDSSKTAGRTHLDVSKVRGGLPVLEYRLYEALDVLFGDTRVEKRDEADLIFEQIGRMCRSPRECFPSDIREVQCALGLGPSAV